MDLKHVKNMTSDTASMFLFSEIGGWGIDGQQFANEISWLGQNGIKTIDVYINSGGGDVLDGLSILRAMQLFDGVINTHIQGIAASIAGVLAMGGATRTMVDFGQIMIHDPSFAGDAKITEQQQNAVDAVRTMLVSIFDKNTTMTPEKISEIMAAETWINSDEAKSLGLIDKIVSTERKFENIFEGITDVGAMVNRAAGVVPKIKSKIKVKKMKGLINHLGLSDDASETAIIDAVKKFQNAAKQAKADLDIANAAKEAAEAKIVEMNKTVATGLVDSAIAAGKIKKDSREAMINMATNDAESFKSMVEAIPAKATKIIDTIDEGVTNALKTKVGDKSFRDLEKTDPELLNEIQKNDPRLFNELFTSEYGESHPSHVEA